MTRTEDGTGRPTVFEFTSNGSLTNRDADVLKQGLRLVLVRDPQSQHPIFFTHKSSSSSAQDDPVRFSPSYLLHQTRQRRPQSSLTPRKDNRVRCSHDDDAALINS